MQQSLWLQTAPTLHLGSLQQDLTCDVCIVGGGLSGLYTAHLLSKAGFDVALVEARQMGHGATGISTGKLSAQQGLFYTKLLQQFTPEQASLYYKCQHQAIVQASEIAEEPIYKPLASTLYATTTKGVNELQQEFEAYKLLGIPGQFGNEHELPIQTKATLTIHNEAQIHPLLFTHQLVRSATKNGAKLFEQTRIQKLQTNQQQIITKEGHTINYKKLILCTHYPLEAVRKLNLLKLRIERAYMLATKIEDPLAQQYLSVEQPTRSIRSATIDEQVYLVMAGSGHPAGAKEHTKKYYEALQQDLRIRFNLNEKNKTILWSSQDIETPDLLPYIGPINKQQSVFIATGFHKWGLTNSLVAGELLLASLTNNPLVEKEMALFSPSRTKLGKTISQAIELGSTTIGEFINGHTMRREAPTCTHLGCKTRWNDADETWDCRCHGSRYTKDGAVLEGPAVYPLDL